MARQGIIEHLENVKLKMQCINCKNKHLICLTYFTVNSVIQDLIQSPGNCKLKLLWSAIWYVCTRSGMYTYSGIWESKKCNRTYHHNDCFCLKLSKKYQWYHKVAISRLLVSSIFKDFQTIYEGEIWRLCTVTFGPKSLKLNSRPVYCSRLYGSLKYKTLSLKIVDQILVSGKILFLIRT